MGPTELIIHDRLVTGLAPDHLELNNESDQHGLPKSAEKHFRTVVVSTKFASLSRLERHRLVQDCVADLLKAQVHAFSVQAFTPEEWKQAGRVAFNSPKCLGGGKREGLS